VSEKREGLSLVPAVHFLQGSLIPVTAQTEFKAGRCVCVFWDKALKSEFGLRERFGDWKVLSLNR